MDIYKLICAISFISILLFCSCTSCSNDDNNVSVSREVYDELQQKYDMLKESVEGTLSANEEAALELNRIMVELNTISGRTITLQKDIETGRGTNTRSIAKQISESISKIKTRLDAVPTRNADKHTLALVKNLRQTIILNEQEIKKLHSVIKQKNQTIEEKEQKISNLDNELSETNTQLNQALGKIKKTENDNWIRMGDELVATAELLPNVKGHGNMKWVKKAKLTILLRAKTAYNQAYKLGRTDAVSKIQLVDEKYNEVNNR